MTEFYDSLYTIRDYRVVNRSFIAAEWSMTSRRFSKTYCRIACWFKGHEPVLRQDMLFVIPDQKIDCNFGLTIHVHGRNLYLGDTVCIRCLSPLRVEGVVVKKLKIKGWHLDSFVYNVSMAFSPALDGFMWIMVWLVPSRGSLRSVSRRKRWQILTSFWWRIKTGTSSPSTQAWSSGLSGGIRDGRPLVFRRTRTTLIRRHCGRSRNSLKSRTKLGGSDDRQSSPDWQSGTKRINQYRRRPLSGTITAKK